MASMSNVTRQDVLDAIALCDELGVEAFLKRHGYGHRFRYQVRHRQRSYPSKAILGVAAGLGHGDLQGGIAQVAPALSRLGFEVRCGTRVIANAGLVDLVSGIAFADLDPGHVARDNVNPLPIEPTAYFLSGSNRPGEIQGLAELGQDIGLAAPEVSPEAEAILGQLAGHDVLVFLDSGAFSEVKFSPAAGGFVIDKLITDSEWRKRLDLYKRLGRKLGSSLVAVAPDRVGSQVETLERLARYRDDLLELRAMGVRLLVAIQKGEVSQAEFSQQVDETLGFADWIPALPCKKAATTAEECAEFVRVRAPKHVHLLGLGIRNQSIHKYLRGFVGTTTSVSLDSNWITASVGRTNGPQNGPRRYTRARDLAKVALGSLAATAGQVARAALLVAFGLDGVLAWASEAAGLFGGPLGACAAGLAA